MRISKKHGLNAGMSLCFFCGASKDVILFGMLPGDKKAPYKTLMDQEPCDQCKEYMKQGIILIQISDDIVDRQNPHRLGGFVVVKERALKNVIADPQTVRDIIKERWCFIPNASWTILGFNDMPES